MGAFWGVTQPTFQSPGVRGVSLEQGCTYKLAPMNRAIRQRSQPGFTLFELVMVMAIIGLLAAIGLPSFKYITTSNRIAAEMNGLVGDLQYARSEAIKQGLPVTVCASSNGTGCSGNTTWNTGWIVFVDLNSNKSVNTGDQILRTQNAFNSTDTMSATNSVTGVTFNREGYAATGATATSVIEIKSSPVVNTWSRCLAITVVGALTVERSGATLPVTCT
jgi:type IV fimbrial biogenesis protein FimT